MSSRSRKNSSSSEDGAQFVAAAVVMLFISGIAQRWLAIWWPLLVLGVVAVLTVVVVWFRHVRAGNRAAAARQAVLDAQVASTDAMSGKAFEQLVARLLQPKIQASTPSASPTRCAPRPRATTGNFTP